MKLSTLVQEHIISRPFIHEAFTAGLINHTALARHIYPVIKQKLGEEVSLSALTMAINRMPASPLLSLEKSLNNFMRQLGNITVRSDLEDISVGNSSSFYEKISRLLSKIGSDEKYFFSMIKGVHESTIVSSKSLVPDLLAVLSKEQIILHRRRLSSISIMLPQANLDTSGVYYAILKRLAWRGLNLVEVISTSNEITLILGIDDVDAAFKEILDLKKGA